MNDLKLPIFSLCCALSLSACALRDAGEAPRYKQAQAADMSGGLDQAPDHDQDLPDMKGELDMRPDMPSRDMDKPDMPMPDMADDMPTEDMPPTNSLMGRQLGASVALSPQGSSDANVLLVAGGPYYPNASKPGEVYYTTINKTAIMNTFAEVTQWQTLRGSESHAGDTFGASVALSQRGRFLAVGAPSMKVGNDLQAGVVFVFEQVNGQWTERAKLNAPTGFRTAYGYFGHSVAISEVNGAQGAIHATLVIGAPHENAYWEHTNLGNGTHIVPKAGAIYVFERQPDGSFSPPTDPFAARFTLTSHNSDQPQATQQRVLGPDSSNWLFGHSVAVDGSITANNVVIAASAPGARGATPPCFMNDSSCDTVDNVGIGQVLWVQGGKLKPYQYIAPTAGDTAINMHAGARFGESVAIRGGVRDGGNGPTGSYTALWGAPMGIYRATPDDVPNNSAATGQVYLTQHNFFGAQQPGFCLIDLLENTGETASFKAGTRFGHRVAMGAMGITPAAGQPQAGCSSLYGSFIADLFVSAPMIGLQGDHHQGAYHQLTELKPPNSTAPWMLGFTFKNGPDPRLIANAGIYDQLGESMAVSGNIVVLGSHLARAEDGVTAEVGKVMVGKSL